MRNAAEVRAAESVEVLFGFFIPFNVKETLIKSRVGDHRSIVSSDVGDIQGSSPICGERIISPKLTIARALPHLNALFPCFAHVRNRLCRKPSISSVIPAHGT